MDLITYIDSILCYCTLGVEPSGKQPASVQYSSEMGASVGLEHPWTEFTRYPNDPVN